MDNCIIKFYQNPALSQDEEKNLLKKLQFQCKSIQSLETEFCFYIEHRGKFELIFFLFCFSFFFFEKSNLFIYLHFICTEKLTEDEIAKLKWILTVNFDVNLSMEDSRLRKMESPTNVVVEIGPKLNFSTALSTNAVSICTNIGLGQKITRIEKSTIYLLKIQVNFRYDLLVDVGWFSYTNI